MTHRKLFLAALGRLAFTFIFISLFIAMKLKADGIRERNPECFVNDDSSGSSSAGCDTSQKTEYKNTFSNEKLFVGLSTGSAFVSILTYLLSRGIKTAERDIRTYTKSHSALLQSEEEEMIHLAIKNSLLDKKRDEMALSIRPKGDKAPSVKTQPFARLIAEGLGVDECKGGDLPEYPQE